jgi:hypothetical protein
MSNKRITDLTELTNPTTDDVFPVVDIATNTTTKVQLGNLPVPSSVTTALATKQDSLVSGTNIKTINSTSVLGSGNIAVQPTLVSGTSIKTVNSNSLLGSGDVAVQETLVSGTNIKTLNNTSLLGSGNIVLTANPSGVSGAIQFSNGSAFASDAANLFWDDTNNRLGIGTNAPISPLNIQSDTTSVGILSVTTSGGGNNRFQISNSNSVSTPVWNIGLPSPDTRISMFVNITLRANGTDAAVFSSSEASFGSISGARLGVRGTGSTSATTSLLVQNSAGTGVMKVTDDGLTAFGPNFLGVRISEILPGYGRIRGYNGLRLDDDLNVHMDMPYNQNTRLPRQVIVGANTTQDASSQLQIDSTTKGFLPPRMTTTQKNAIASPAAGLVVYDSTTNKLCCYNGSTWNDLF